METIKVNMTPCEDIKTIHASQNDNEAREWGFELHNNGEKIDSSSISDQLVFKAYEGGTEEILPENGSTPTTSPFKGDIRYPQGLLTDQEFLYRESPTEEDGLAKITEIKGNTLVWNQLVNGFPATTEWNGITITNNDDKSITLNGTYTGSSTGNLYVSLNNISADPTHWYLYDFNNVNLENMIIRISSGVNTGSLHGGCTINTVTSSVSGRLDLRIPVDKSFDNVKIVPQMFDLTQMFGAEIAQQLRNMELETFGKGVDYFRSLFSLSYYSYNQGSLLSFMGNGIKTVGKNLIDWKVNVTASACVINNPIPTTYILSAEEAVGNGNWYIRCDDGSETYPYTQAQLGLSGWQKTSSGWVYGGGSLQAFTFIIPIGCTKIEIGKAGTNGTINAQLEFGSTATDFEPYTSSLAELPISQYFSNGMKSAGNVYDELTESKAITRIGSVDLGTLSFFYNSSSSFFYATIPDLVNGMTYATESPNVIVQNFEYKGGGVGWANMPNMSYGFNGQDIRIKNTAYTSSAEFVRAVSGTYMLYELATYEETSFTTASLVTENAEIPLSNDDGTLIGKCTEELSENPGFIDAKIKLADADGECYSNKIQLHVERKPS